MFCILLLRKNIVPFSLFTLEKQHRDPFSGRALHTAEYNPLEGEDKQKPVPFPFHCIS